MANAYRQRRGVSLNSPPDALAPPVRASEELADAAAVVKHHPMETTHGCEKAGSDSALMNLHALNGLLFKHVSPLRGQIFLSREITRAVAAVAKRLKGMIEAQAKALAGPGAPPRR